MGSKIIVTNTAIIINNYNIGDCVKLENCFKIYNASTHSYYYIGIYYDADTKKLYLPRGIDIWYVENLIGEPANILVNKYYKYHTYTDAMIKYGPRDDEQKEALRFMLGKQEYLKNQSKSQLSVNLSTGKGKTYLSIAMLSYLGIRGMMITSTVDWINQWKDKTLEYTDMNQKDVYIIRGSGNISRLLRMSEDQLSRYKLFLVTHDSLRSYADKNGWESIGDLLNHLKIGIKIFDEAHLNFGNMCMIDYFTNVYKTYYLTATPNKSQERENEVYQLSFRNIPAINLFDENNDPHTSYIALMFNSLPTPSEVSMCKNSYGMDRNKYTNYVVMKDTYKKLLTVLVDLSYKLVPANEKILIYIGTNNAIGITYNWMIEAFPELKGHIGVYTSIISNEDKKKALSKRFILSTTKSAGAAVDISGLSLTIALAEPYRSEITARQSLGRTRRDNTTYIDVIDTGFEQCRKFYYKKIPTFEKYAKDCSIIKIDKNELETRYINIMSLRAERNMPVIKKKLFSRTSISEVEMSKPRLFSNI